MNKFEEYKLFVEDTARFSDRRQTVSNIFVTINSLILSAMAFLVKEAIFVSQWRTIVVIPVLIAGIVICLQWDRLILRYKRLIKLRFDELRDMEDHPEMADSHKMYHQEDKLYPRDSKGKLIHGKGLNIADRERWLPKVFIGMYAFFMMLELIAFLVYPLFVGKR